MNTEEKPAKWPPPTVYQIAVSLYCDVVRDSPTSSTARLVPKGPTYRVIIANFSDETSAEVIDWANINGLLIVGVSKARRGGRVKILSIDFRGPNIDQKIYSCPSKDHEQISPVSRRVDRGFGG